ncbi:uncharacterized protein LOC126733087 [Quercus robur]|uniref:uncharacterized protein LOC126733087 n=1 Tax=Quercus robur TaxID=38942 RepID=UPI002162BD24|nr:uncharacterized protein LOC126733087 [Quercus robur]
MTEDFDDLVDPWTLAFYCLGPDSSAFVLRNIEIEEKKRMTTKFNQEMCAKMRLKKNEPQSNLGKRTVHVTRKGTPVTSAIPIAPAVLGIETTRTTSPATSVEEIATLAFERTCLIDKGKEKVDSRSSSVWENKELAVERAYEVVTIEDLKVFSGVPSNEVVARHVHKLVQC